MVVVVVVAVGEVEVMDMGSMSENVTVEYSSSYAIHCTRAAVRPLRTMVASYMCPLVNLANTVSPGCNSLIHCCNFLESAKTPAFNVSNRRDSSSQQGYKHSQPFALDASCCIFVVNACNVSVDKAK